MQRSDLYGVISPKARKNNATEKRNDNYNSQSKKLKIMKTLVLTALMGVSVATTNANVKPADAEPARITAEAPAAIDQHTQAFIERIALHQWYVNTVWQQYDQAVATIKNKVGSVKDLQTQMNTLIKYYQDDIDQGVRLQDSRKAIDEVYALYTKKINKQAKVEAKQITRLQALLGIELEREENDFEALVKANSDQINAHSEPVIRDASRQFANSAINLKALQGSASLAAR